MKNKSIILLCSLILASCAASQVMMPSQTDVNRVSAKYPNYTLAELNQGKALYEKNCGNCHGLKKPTSRDEAQWNHIVPEMVEKANKKAGKEEITAKDQELIIKYLVTMGSAPKVK